MKAASCEAVPWPRRYEALRAEAIAGAGGALPGSSLGMYLIVQYGVTGWMMRWPEGTGGALASMRPEASSSPVPAEAVAFVPPCQRQLALLLAQMTFQQLSNGSRA